MPELNLKPKKIDLFSDDRAFELMTTAAEGTNVDIMAGLERDVKKKLKEKSDKEFEEREFGEVSAWSPTGQVLGMKTPRGFGALWDLLSFGAMGGGLTKRMTPIVEESLLKKSAEEGARWTRDWNRHPYTLYIMKNSR